MVAIAVTFIYSWRSFNEIPLVVIGQPSSTGLLQKQKEEPFFTGLKAQTGIPFAVKYKPLESVGFKDTHQLQMLNEGLFDLVSLRLLQNVDAEPGLMGLDLVGMSTNYSDAKKVVAAYSGTVDHYLQERFHAKLLGVWTFGPQEFFCRKPVRRLEDIKGLRVRVGSRAIAVFISALQGSPAVIGFDDTKNALAVGLVDCAVSSAASANSAGWPEVAKYNYPLAIQFGLNGYAISLKKWNALSAKEQSILKTTFDQYIADLWKFALDIQIDATSCNTGGPCKHGHAYRIESNQPLPSDLTFMEKILKEKVLPDWGEQCDKVHPGCLREWQDKLYGH